MTTDPWEQVAEPSDADAWTGRGRALQEQKRYEEALQAFERTLELEPENAEAWRWKASALAHLARHAEVLASVERALALDPENDWALWRKGRTLSCLKRDEEALDALDQALRLNPASLLAWLDKGCTLYALGHYKEARDAFAEAQRLDPDNEYAASKVRAVQALLKREIPDKLLRLRDGRQLGYIDCGDPNGKPVFCFHGVPGSRLNWVTEDEPFRGHRLRLIAPDRPGMGLSDFTDLDTVA